MPSLKKFIRSWLGISDNGLELEPQRKNATVEPVKEPAPAPVNKLEVTEEFYLRDDYYGVCHLYRWRRMSNDRIGTLQLEYVKGQPDKGHVNYNCPKAKPSTSLKFHSN